MNKMRLNVAGIEPNSSNFVNIVLSVAGWGLLASVYLPFPYAIPIAIISILVTLFSMNKTTLGLSLMFFVPHILGVLFSITNISIPPIFVCVAVASFLLGFQFYTQKEVTDSLIRFALLMIVFFIWYLFGPRHDYSTTKIVYIFFFGLITIFSMRYFISRYDIQYLKIAILLGLISVTYIVVGIEFYHYGRPQDYFDISFIRDSFYSLMRDEATLPFTYHTIGNTAFIGMAFLLCRQRDELNAVMKYQILSFLLIVIILSQARQAFFGSLLLLYFKVFVNRSSGGKRFFSIGLITLLAVWIVGYIALNSDVFLSTLQASNAEEAVNRSYDRAIDMFKGNVLIGSGLGGYSLSGQREYPHNILLELLSEMGLIGTLLVFAATLFPFISKFKRWFNPTVTGVYPLMLIIPYFIRSLSSSDLTENIIFLTMMIVFSQEKDTSFSFPKIIIKRK